MDYTEAGSLAEVPGHREHAETSRPAITPTLVLGLGGTGTTTIRCLKRRLVWLWHRKEIEADLERRPDHFDPIVWQEEIWRRYEVAGGPPTIQLLAVDTIPWMNRAGQVYLCRHEYAYLGAYNATTVLRNLENHPETEAWWGWERSRPGQIHSGARQIRAIGRLSLYRRYRELWSQLWPRVDKISHIEARQETEKKGYPVAPAGAAKRIYIITSLCGGTGAGIYLDLAARLRACFREMAIITGIFALPSVFLAELQSELQQSRVQANAYAALKEIDYFQSHAFESWLPGEERVEVEPLFTRLYLVERQNKAGESLNSVADICQLIANQVFLESMTDVGSQVWEYDVNATMERRKKQDRVVSYVFSSFANSSLLVPRDQMLSFCELKYTAELIALGLARELTADERNDLNAEARTALGHLEQVVAEAVGQGAALAGGDELGGEELLIDEEGAAPTVEPQAPVSALGPLEQLAQEENRAILSYGLNGGLFLAQLLAKSLEKRLEDCRKMQELQTQEVDRLDRELQQALTNRPLSVRLNVPPFSLFTRAARQAYERRIAALRRSLEAARGRLEDLNRERAQWSLVQATMDPLVRQFEARLQLLLRIGKERVEVETKRLFQGTKIAEQRPYEMFRMVLTEEYITQTLWPEVQQTGLALRRRHDVTTLLQPPLDASLPRICEVCVVTSSIRRAGAMEYQSTLEIAPCDIEPLWGRVRRVARQAVGQFIKDDMLYIRRFLEEPRFAIQSRLRDFFNRCEPFWRYDLDLGGFSEKELEQVSLAGVHNTADPAWKYLLRDFTGDFTLVDTDDPTRLDACRIEHGLPVEFLQVLPELKKKYDEFYRQDAGPMHLDARWEPDGSAPLPELIGCPPSREEEEPPTPVPGGGEGPVRPAPTAGGQSGTGGPHDAGAGTAPEGPGADAEPFVVDKGTPIEDEHATGAGEAPSFPQESEDGRGQGMPPAPGASLTDLV